MGSTIWEVLEPMYVSESLHSYCSKHMHIPHHLYKLCGTHGNPEGSIYLMDAPETTLGKYAFSNKQLWDNW